MSKELGRRVAVELRARWSLYAGTVALMWGIIAVVLFGGGGRTGAENALYLAFFAAIAVVGLLAGVAALCVLRSPGERVD